MNLTITGRHYDVPDALKIFIKEKLSKIQMMDEAISIQATLTLEKTRNTAEFLVKGKDFMFQAQEQSSDMTQSVDAALEKIERQARKHKEMYKSRRQKNNELDTAQFVTSELSSTDEGFMPEIIETDKFIPKPMSIEEAAEQLSLSKASFMVFRNSRNDKINVLYVRKDGNYGLIQPE